MKNRLAILAAVAVALSARADSFSGRIVTLPQWTHSKTIGASTVTETFANFLDWTHASGTGTNQMNTIIRETATLTPGAGRTVSLAGGFTDAFGDATTFTSVRFLCLQSAAANYGEFLFGGAESGAWTNIVGTATDQIRMHPGATLMLVAPNWPGYGVGGGNVCVTNAGISNVTYTIYIGGTE